MPSRKRKTNKSAAAHAKEKNKRGFFLEDISPLKIFYVSLSLLILTSIWHFQAQLSIIGDNAQFLTLAESLVKGRGYEYANFPYPAPSTKYPFGYPFLLAPLFLLFNYHTFIGYKILTLLLTWGSLYLVYKLFENENPLLSNIVVLLTALNLLILEYSSLILSEIPYLFFSLWGLVLFQKWEKNQNIRNFLVALLIISIAYYMRSIGIVFGGALLLYFAVRREIKLLLIGIAVLIVLALPWNIWTQMHGGSSYFQILTSKNPYSPYLGTVSASDMVQRAFFNFKGYFFSYIPEVYLPGFINFTKKLPQGQSIFLGILLIVPLLVGYIVRLVRNRSLMEFYLLGYMGTLLLWPEVWLTNRFLVGIVPFIIFYFLLGFREIPILLKWQSSISKPLLQFVFLILLIPTLWGQLNFQNTQTIYTPDWKNYFAAAEWVKNNTSPETIVACRKPYLFYIRSTRKTVKFKLSRKAEEIINDFRKKNVDVLIYDGFFWSGTTRRYLGPVIRKYPNRFAVLKEYKNPSTYVLKLNLDN